MDRYLLVGGSITAILIIVFASFTNVVGYDFVRSPRSSESPLFRIRTQHAISDNQEDHIISKYLGKGKNSSLMKFKRIDTFNSVYDSITKIQLMDDETFRNFVSIVVRKLSQQEPKDAVDANKIIYGLYQLRSTSNTFDGNQASSDERTWRVTPTLCWFPGCGLILVPLFILLVTIVFILVRILTVGFPYLC